MFIVRGGKIDWAYTYPGKGEISDATRLSNGNILFAHQFGVTEITADKKVVWNYDTPKGNETHVAKPIGLEHIFFIQNGDPAKLFVVNTTTGKTEREFELPVKNPKTVHPQFRDAELTDAGTVLVAHMDMGKVVEYDSQGKSLWSVDVPGVWSVSPLKNGNILCASNRRFVREINRDGKTVWEFNPSIDTPDYRLPSMQTAQRLPNGNTLINNWQNQWSAKEKLDLSNLPLQAIEITPDKQVVWALREWTDPNNLGPATRIQLLDDPAAVPENKHFGEFN
jgi:outer membrane protein assembly factor BamB